MLTDSNKSALWKLIKGEEQSETEHRAQTTSASAHLLHHADPVFLRLYLLSHVTDSSKWPLLGTQKEGPPKRRLVDQAACPSASVDSRSTFPFLFHPFYITLNLCWFVLVAQPNDQPND